MPNHSATESVTISEPKLVGVGESRVIEKLIGGELVFLAAVLLLWTLLLATGIFIASQPYRDALGQAQLNPNPLAYAATWFKAFVSYTFTNIAMLSGLASLAGAGARHAEAQLAAGERITSLRALYASAALRGFFVYLIALSGLMVFAENFSQIAQTPDLYVRLAGFISLLSFMLGFNPELFARFLERIARLLEDQSSQSRP
jgi:hypothetical protein